jgi:phosphohistidine phosphatase
MKTLILMRHGKSDWAEGGQPDFERPLAPRGIKAAKQAGRLLDKAGLRPDKVLTSAAERARRTAELAYGAGGFAGPLEIKPELYETSPPAALEVIRRGGQEATVLLVVGHEPTTSGLIALLAGGGRHEVVTAALAGIEADIDSWEDLTPGRATLTFLLPPRLLEV